ncbi:H-NS histone family protein [Paraburkholderia dilworthii]|uniref:H-NS histone family protein n=1 Tax=Paraburkholderia dilworthii TaxID=948106 RepID=UPI0038B8EA8E
MNIKESPVLVFSERGRAYMQFPLVVGIPSSAASVNASKKKPADNYVRGPQAPKYRDPKSGATWSGRGRAPAWLSGAKDRSRFLIDGATADVAVAKTSKAKVAAQKTVAKKVPVAKKAVVAKKVVASKKAADTAAVPETFAELSA